MYILNALSVSGTELADHLLSNLGRGVARSQCDCSMRLMRIL